MIRIHVPTTESKRAALSNNSFLSMTTCLIEVL